MIRILFLMAIWFATGTAIAGPVSPRDAVSAYHKNPAQAVELLARARSTSPTLASALGVLMADSLLRTGRRLEARNLASKLASDDRWGHWASWTEARAAMPDDCDGSLRALKSVRADPPWVSTAQILDLEVRARQACQDGDGAGRALRRLAIEHPHTSLGVAALTKVSLSPSEQLRRAKAFEAARLYPKALRVLRSLDDSVVRDRARFETAHILLTRTRDNFGEATRTFARLCEAGGEQDQQACFLAAKSKGRGGDVIGAISGFETYRRMYPRGRFAGDAVFFSGFLRYETGRHLQARQVFLGITRGPWAKPARWYAAWSAYLAGRCDLAEPEFELIARGAKGGTAKRRAAYWALRCIEQRDPAEAQRRAVNLAGEQRFDWYTLLLWMRYPERFSPFRFAPESTATTPGRVKVFKTQVREIRDLAAAGLDRFAQRALAVVAPRIRAAGYWQLEVRLAREIGDWRRVLQGALDARGQIFAGRPDSDDLALWRMAYPTGFKEIVDTESKRHQMPAELIYSFIRKESAFQRTAVSHAHAVGLMQLLPRTAKRIGRERGDPASKTAANSLFEARRNVDLGSWYVAALDKRFGGQLPLVAAAYNAGPRSVLSWFRGRPSVATDVFVESIPFKETREYVKRLVRTYTIYTLLNGGGTVTDALTKLPLNLNLTVRPGIDF